VYGVLPKSYFPPNVVLSDAMPHSVEGGSADVWKGKQGGTHMCIKAFRTQITGNFETLKLVRGRSLLQQRMDWT